MSEMTGAQALIRSLRAEGVDTLFALPGAQIMTAFDALYDYRDEINLVQTRHEQATTYMADGYAKASGRVGVAMVVPGPGALNAASGLGTAYASSSPVLLISGQITSASMGKRQGQLHEIDNQLEVFKTITKWNHLITSVEEIPEAVHEAFRHLKSGRPRPVELEIPPDILAATGNTDLVELEEYPHLPADAMEIKTAVQILRNSERPCIMMGGGVVISDCGAEVIELAELLQAPMILTPEAKGAVPDSHPLLVGGAYGGLGPTEKVFSQSDAVLAIGTRFYFRDMPMDDLKIVHIDVDPEEIGKNYPTNAGVVADAKKALTQLIPQLRAIGAERNSRVDEVSAYRKEFIQKIQSVAPDQLGIVESIAAELNEDDIVVSGITTIGYWSNITYPARKPRTFLTSSYFGTLGYAFPTALGAKVAYPDRNVVALSGDGGFMYNPQELSTAVKNNINAVCIVFNNNAYGASEWDQMARYNGRYIGTNLLNPDFVKLAESFGAVGMRTDPQFLGSALREALGANAPVLLEVTVPNMAPPFQVDRR